MMQTDDRSEWIRYYDSDSSAFYWYNHRTGESQWDEESHISEMNQLEEKLSLITSSQHSGTAMVDLGSLVSGVKHSKITSNKASKSDDSRPLSTTPTTANQHPGKNKLSINNAPNLSSEQNRTKAKPKKKKSKFSIPPTGNGDESEEDENNENNFDMKCYWRFVLCNAIFIEQPFCFAEAVIRLAILTVALLLTIIYNVVFFSSERWRLRRIYIRMLKDILLTTAAACTLLLPGSIIFIYKSFSTEADWTLAGIPTLFGRVDCRRFATVTVFGAGTQAINATASFQDRDSLDRWSDSVFIYPRNFIADLRHFLAGRRGLESLEEGLSVDES